MSEEEFTKKMNSLELSVIKSVKSGTPKNHPFSFEIGSADGNINSSIFGEKCDCNKRTANFSGNSSSQGHQHLVNKYSKSSLFLEKNLKNPIYFKQKIRNDKKNNLIRASVLKNVGKCCIHQNNQKNQVENVAIERNLNFRVRAKSFGEVDKKRNYLDFKELIKQCTEIRNPTQSRRFRTMKNLLSSDSEEESETNPDFASSCFKQLRINDGSKSAAAVRPRRNSTSSTELSDEKLSQLSLNASTSNSASCSQQARMDMSDVTIDEIASYFENNLYIPKKVSILCLIVRILFFVCYSFSIT
jgi:hypothetical protein